MMRYNPKKQNQWEEKKHIAPNDRIDATDEIDLVEAEEDFYEDVK